MQAEDLIAAKGKKEKKKQRKETTTRKIQTHEPMSFWHSVCAQLSLLLLFILILFVVCSFAPPNLILDEGGEREKVKEGRKLCPDISRAVLSQALIVEAVDLGDLTALVVAAQNGYSVWEADLERDKVGDRLNAVVASVHVVAHEEVVCVGQLATNAEELHKVVELTVDVTAHGHGAAHGLHVGLLLKDLHSLFQKGRVLSVHGLCVEGFPTHSHTRTRTRTRILTHTHTLSLSLFFLPGERQQQRTTSNKKNKNSSPCRKGQTRLLLKWACIDAASPAIDQRPCATLFALLRLRVREFARVCVRARERKRCKGEMCLKKKQPAINQRQKPTNERDMPKFIGNHQQLSSQRFFFCL